MVMAEKTAGASEQRLGCWEAAESSEVPNSRH